MRGGILVGSEDTIVNMVLKYYVIVREVISTFNLFRVKGIWTKLLVIIISVCDTVLCYMGLINLIKNSLRLYLKKKSHYIISSMIFSLLPLVTLETILITNFLIG